MIKQFYIIILTLVFIQCSTKQSILVNTDLTTPFEKNTNYSSSYQEAIAYYQTLADQYKEVSIQPFGMTDSGHPLHEVIISSDDDIDAKKIKAKGYTVLLINNAIHPGEPCGVDASMMLARDLVKDKELSSLLQDVVVVIVPFYNISGALNRGSYSRANQLGPEEYGFRGNVRHLDLNRDFVKCDTKNAQSFNQLLSKWRPEVMIDNHTSNGADYQYVMTLIATQKDQLNQHVSKHMTEVMLPELYSSMETKRYEMTPYVYARNTPDEGIYGFLDLPRYSSGYAAMHNTISFMPETHMLKAYADRVLSTYDFSVSMLEHIQRHRSALMQARQSADADTQSKETFALRYTVDTDQVETVTFKGYEAKYKPSEVTGQPRLYYDRDSPYTKEISYYNTYKPTLTTAKPKAYLIPQAYTEIVERLQWNGVQVDQITADDVWEVKVYYIDSYKDQDAYEGHYLHYDVELSSKMIRMPVYAGDYIVYTDQRSNNYIMATLEPQHPDSFFAWNFMDGILMQKEYFSPYVFEDLAAQMLREDAELQSAFDAAKKNDPELAADARAQLNWIYKRSPYYEDGYRRYPIVRIEK